MPNVPDLVLRFAEAFNGARTAAALEALLHADAVALCDGDAEVYGAAAVAGLVIALLGGRPGAVLTVESVNGRPGLALRRDDTVLAVVAMRATADRITGLWIVLNPAKLRHWHHP